MSLFRGVWAFFFFFTFWHSPSFEDPAFLRFSHACYAVRRVRPSLTISGLRTVLSVAAAGRPLGYEEISTTVGHEYSATAHQIAALADGRGRHAGLRLLTRAKSDHGREREVTCTRLGQAIALRYVKQREQLLTCGEHRELIRATTLPAFEKVSERNAALTLGTLSAFLFIATHQESFGYDGSPANIITSQIGLRNLSKHLRVLEVGDGTSGSQLIETHPQDYDNRIRLPVLTSAGLNLVCELVAALTKAPVIPPRKPHAASLDKLETKQDISMLKDDDFDDFGNIDNMN